MWYLEYTYYDQENKCYAIWVIGLNICSIRKITEAKKKAEQFLIDNPNNHFERQTFILTWSEPLESSVPQAIFKPELVTD